MMKGVACNPYLPLWEYVPDGEPRVFGDRLYVYGSHDRSGGNFFCVNDYVVWSAPLYDLTDWRCEGVSYRREQDPHNPDGKWELFAPDVVQGGDGRYYLFYCLRIREEFGVAVSENPAGPFTFYGHIRRPDGSIFDSCMPYDPSVLVDDDGKVYLYYGFGSELITSRYGVGFSEGCMTVRLSDDLLTVLSEPVILIPRQEHTAGTGYEGHGYVEAPSMRKIDGKYYLIYSSEVNHELCYAVSDRPDAGFAYGGVIISNGDMGLNGRTYPVYPLGNNHGGLVRINHQDYIFYQRHTRCNQFSRQGCAEKVTIRPDGTIPQVEITSCGLNDGPLPAEGTWNATICCHLTAEDPQVMRKYRELDPERDPCVWEDNENPVPQERTQYVRNIRHGTTLGFKYFSGEFTGTLAFTLRGSGSGTLDVYLDTPEQEKSVAQAVVAPGTTWHRVDAPIQFSGTHAVYLTYRGTGCLDLRDLTFG